MATLIAAKDSSPIEDAETIKRACKGYILLQFCHVSKYLYVAKKV